jgi:hypothetical protein
MPSPDESPQRTLAAALGAMLGVALVVGLAVAGVILTVVKLSGVGGERDAQEAAPQSMFMPEYQPTQSAAPRPSGSGGSQQPTRSPSATPSNAIRLEVSPREASPGDQLDFSGTYRGGDGASLQVQRKEGGSWIDFPVTATVQNERFATYIITSRAGKNTFRVYDKDEEQGSNAVTVTLE